MSAMKRINWLIARATSTSSSLPNSHMTSIQLPLPYLYSEMNTRRALFLGPRTDGPVAVIFRPRRSEGRSLRPNVAPTSRASSDHPTLRFIHQISRGCPLQETDLYNSIESGLRVVRRINGEQLVLNNNSIHSYQSRIESGLAFAKRYGILDVHDASAKKLLENSYVERTNIGIAVVRGRTYFYRTGHHRLGYAFALGLREVPCDLLLWDRDHEAFAIKEGHKHPPLDVADEWWWRDG